MLELNNFFLAIQIWIALMLTVQSVILYKLLPQIIAVAENTEIGKKIIEAAKTQFVESFKEKFKS